MMSYPSVSILIITYKRTAIALRTISGLQQHLQYSGPLHWHIADDGSNVEHIEALHNAIGNCTLTNSKRQGVGVSMNLGMTECFNHSDFILWLEDDWYLEQPFNLDEHVKLLTNNVDLGMVQLGYISPGIKGELISAEGLLWWRLAKGPQYTFTGHAALRHRRFFEAYGFYKPGLAPGYTELYMCGTFNGKQGPDIVVPAWTGIWGVFSHIGSESLKDVQPV